MPTSHVNYKDGTLKTPLQILDIVHTLVTIEKLERLIYNEKGVHDKPKEFIMKRTSKDINTL